MKTAAVICELNPAHNGHKYIFDEIKKRSGADHLIALMSGNYVQRGEPALLDKYVRTRMALMMGADLVLELPSPFSFQSAREFAMAGVSLAAASGIVDVLGFGAEFPDEDSDNNGGYAKSFSDILREAAVILLEEPEAYKEALKSELKKGISYPLASEFGLKVCGIEAAEIISSPNNILAREYLRALLLISKKCGCSRSLSDLHDNRDDHTSAGIETLIIPRIGDGYNDDMPRDANFASATALRRLLLSDASLDQIRTYIPAELCDIYDDIISGISPMISSDDMSNILNFRLLSLIREDCSIDAFDVPEELYNRIIRGAEKPFAFSERISAIKSKRYTYTRISRALLNISLGVTESEVSNLKENGYVPYIRILGFRRQASELLTELKEHAAAPIVSNAAASRDLLSRSVFYDNIYYSLMSSSCRRSFQNQKAAFSAAETNASKPQIKNEYERQIIII